MITVTLIDGCKWPIETVYCLWEASKGRKDVVRPEQVHDEMTHSSAYGVNVRDDYAKKVEGLFIKLLDDAVPIMENIHFTFMLEGVPIYLREQLVRHRIVSSVGERIGADIVPDLSKSTFWAQSMRILLMRDFADNHEYHVPDTLNDSQKRIFTRAMLICQDVYRQLMEEGVIAEDARAVIPLAATHRLSWTLNLKALKHIIGNRSCWILQAGIWGPVIEGMVSELCREYGIIFQQLISPPCIKANEFVRCLFVEDNERRIEGKDLLSPCTLYLQKVYKPTTLPGLMWKPQGREFGDGTLRPYGPPVEDPPNNDARWTCRKNAPVKHMMKQIEIYENLWGRNVWTGELII